MLSIINKPVARLCSLVLASPLIFVGCGGTGQDNGRASSFERMYSGLVIDGYLARATVFLDTNNDGTRNAWEPFVFTDNQGYFSFNPVTDTDYCAATASADQAQYCLVATSDYANVVLRVDSGYDVLTGEPFAGQMSRRLHGEQAGSNTGTLVSPITSILTNINNAADEQAVLSALGLDRDDVDVDYLNVAGGGEIDTQIFNAATKLHKVVVVLGDRITDTYSEIGEEIGTPNDASSAVYAQLAQQLLSSGQDFDTTIADPVAMATVLDNTEAAMQVVYERKELNMPADMGSSSSPEQFSRVIDVAGSIVTVVNSVVDVNQAQVTQEQALGQSRAIESVVIKALNETSDDATIDNAVAFFSHLDNRPLVAALIDSLATDTADATALAANDFIGSDFNSIDDIARVTQLPASATPFTQIGGLQMRVSDLDLGSAPDNLDDSEFELYFSGDATATDGAFIACVKYIDGANIDGTLGDGNTRGELVEGFWSLLGASESKMSSYSLLITITFLETTYQAIMKPAGAEQLNGVQYQRVRFDSDGDIRVWHSPEGMVERSERPQTDDECEQRLPSRIGI